jgi:hypothetical protein
VRQLGITYVATPPQGVIESRKNPEAGPRGKLDRPKAVKRVRLEGNRGGVGVSITSHTEGIPYETLSSALTISFPSLYLLAKKKATAAATRPPQVRASNVCGPLKRAPQGATTPTELTSAGRRVQPLARE